LENPTPERLAVLHDAMGMWNDVVADGEELSEVSEGEGWPVRFVPPEVLGPYNLDGLTCHSGPFDDADPPCPPGETVILIDEGVMDYIEEWRPRSIFAHELGHSMGLDHVPHEGALMTADVIETAVLTSWDIAECVDEGVCPASRIVR